MSVMFFLKILIHNKVHVHSSFKVMNSSQLRTHLFPKGFITLRFYCIFILLFPLQTPTMLKVLTYVPWQMNKCINYPVDMCQVLLELDVLIS